MQKMIKEGGFLPLIALLAALVGGAASAVGTCGVNKLINKAEGRGSFGTLGVSEAGEVSVPIDAPKSCSDLVSHLLLIVAQLNQISPLVRSPQLKQACCVFLFLVQRLRAQYFVFF